MSWITGNSEQPAIGGQPTLHRPALPQRPTLSEIRARIRRYNTDLDCTSPTFMAAVLLLTGAEYGHNIDMLARRTGYDRCFVARSVRRLIDNGVWKHGQTVANWSQADEASGTFWNDVAVAEGRMCRRLDENGLFEWAPAGYWNKSFVFADADADTRIANTYHDPAAGQEAEIAAVQAAEAVSDHEAPSEMVIGGPAKLVPPNRNGLQPMPPPVPSLDVVFNDAVWIG